MASSRPPPASCLWQAGVVRSASHPTQPASHTPDTHTLPFLPPCSSPSNPIFFVLFPGYSPSSQIEVFARTGRQGVSGAHISKAAFMGLPTGSPAQSAKLWGCGACPCTTFCRPAGHYTCLPVLCLAVGKTAERGNFAVISMGQGQEAPAERLLEKYMSEVGT